MGLDVDAVAGIGIIVDLYAISEEDAREELVGAMYRPYRAGELMVAAVGDAERGDRYFFVGYGAKHDWSETIDGVPVTLPGEASIRADIKAFLAALPCTDGTWLTLYNERNFGFHVHTYTS